MNLGDKAENRQLQPCVLTSQTAKLILPLFSGETFKCVVYDFLSVAFG